jgi:hypothetical protein
MQTNLKESWYHDCESSIEQKDFKKAREYLDKYFSLNNGYVDKNGAQLGVLIHGQLIKNGDSYICANENLSECEFHNALSCVDIAFGQDEKKDHYIGCLLNCIVRNRYNALIKNGHVLDEVMHFLNNIMKTFSNNYISIPCWIIDEGIINVSNDLFKHSEFIILELLLKETLNNIKKDTCNKEYNEFIIEELYIKTLIEIAKKFPLQNATKDKALQYYDKFINKYDIKEENEFIKSNVIQFLSSNLDENKENL